ncbi:MAG: alpha/beta hydrolase [Thermodesulfobacteriota bacterium]
MTRPADRKPRLGLFLALLILAAAGCGLTVQILPSGRVPSPTDRDKFIKVGQVNFHYTEYSGPGQKVVLIHGFASSTYTWEEVAPLLNQKGCHVLALDMKGFGWSDKPLGARYDPITLMEEVNQWLEALNLREVVLAGNSLGGAVAWLMALEHPDKVSRLVLVDAAGYPKEKPFIVKLAGMPLAGSLAKLFFGPWMVRRNLSQVMHDQSRVTPPRVQAYFDRLRTEGGLEAQIAVSRALDAKAFESYIKRIPEIKVPTLLLWGREDKWIPLETIGLRFQRELTNSTLAVLPGCGHIPQEEQPEKTSALILDFIEGRPIPDYRPPAKP